MNIGQAAARSGVTAKMIRYYESVDLIPAPERTTGNYRHYDSDAVQRLQFVRRARDLGFPVERIRELVKLWTDPHRCSSKVKTLVLIHIADLESRIADMHAMAATLRRLAEACEGDDRPECAIIDGLDPGAALPLESRRRRPSRAPARRKSAPR